MPIGIQGQTILLLLNHNTPPEGGLGESINKWAQSKSAKHVIFILTYLQHVMDYGFPSLPSRKQGIPSHLHSGNNLT